ncbi:S41 family peptidase [Pseudomonas sp. Hp2]|uniref:S41 family peptidase n=1 Tax=Pseudomonas sp. Hp2 TaxID=701189 RepID=UPI0015AAA779|nr:S41 family peptidase [Pseudomonas sp. Hp2]
MRTRRIRDLVLPLLCLLMPPAMAQPRAPQDPGTLDPAPRAIAVRAADLLERGYLDPASGQAYAERLRHQATVGAYDALGGQALADQLTADLQRVKQDRHLKVSVGGPPAAGPGPVMIAGPKGAGPAPGGAPSAIGGPMRRRAPAIEHAGWIAPGIAYIRYNEFPYDEEITRQTREFLAAHAQARTVIFDLRTHRGGGPAQMDVIFPELFSQAQPLVGMESRQAGSPALSGPGLRPSHGGKGNIKEYWVEPAADAPLAKARVYVLTSNATGSAGEMFAAALKWSGRGTLVGASTAGANHFGGMEPLGGGLMLFLPDGRTFNLKDGKDWEGDGIAPDIEVTPEHALSATLQREGVSQADADALETRYLPHLPMTRPPMQGVR